jgi:hypothetical protein
MKQVILILIFILPFFTNANEIKMDEKKCNLFAFYSFINESHTKSMMAVFDEAHPSMSLLCQKEIKDFRQKELEKEKVYGFKIDGSMITRYDGDRLRYTKPLKAISEIGSISRTIDFELYTFSVTFLNDYISNSRVAEKTFYAVYFDKSDALLDRKRLIKAYNNNY